MGEVVAVLALMAGLVLAGTVGLCWLGWRSLRRHNEVSAARPTRPPLRWMVSPGSCARLHRRLRDCTTTLRLAVPAPRARRLRRAEVSPLAILASEIESHAVLLDGELLVVARTRGASGSARRRQAAQRVEELERSALRLANEARRCGRTGTESVDDALRRISEHLDARDAAWAELARIERDAGLSATA